MQADAKTEEHSFNSTNPFIQPTVNYGAVEQTTGHPFAYQNNVVEENVQPAQAYDPYTQDTTNYGWDPTTEGRTD